MFDPMLPEAPGLLSTTNGWPNDFDRCSESVRARMSVEPPGAQGTIIVTGLSGHAPCARASVGANGIATMMASIALGGRVALVALMRLVAMVVVALKTAAPAARAMDCSLFMIDLRYSGTGSPRLTA